MNKLPYFEERLNRYTKYKIGQTVYLICGKEILEMKIEGFYIYKDKIHYYQYRHGAFFSAEKLYATRQEAEKALGKGADDEWREAD